MSYRNPVRQVGVAGTVEVTGTVATTTPGSGGGGTTSAIRTAKTFAKASGNSFSFTAPTDTKAGDLILVALSFLDNAGNTFPQASETGWTTATSFGRGSAKRTLLRRVADSGDVNGARTYSFTLASTGGQANGYPTGVVNAFAGVDTFTVVDITQATQGRADMALPSYASPKIALCWPVTGFASSAATTIPATTWTNPSAPASPQPTWKGDRIRLEDTGGAVGLFAAEAPAVAGSFGIRQLTNDDAISNNWDFLTGVLSKA